MCHDMSAAAGTGASIRLNAHLSQIQNRKSKIENALEPPAHDDFLLGVKRHGVFAVGVQVAEEGILPAGEGEEGHGRGDADVDSHHAHFNAR